MLQSLLLSSRRLVSLGRSERSDSFSLPSICQRPGCSSQDCLEYRSGVGRARRKPRSSICEARSGGASRCIRSMATIVSCRGLFKDSRFVVLLVGGAIGVFPLFVPAFFIPLFGTSIGLTPSAASYLLAGWNLASACGRIGFGLGADAMFGSVNSLVLCLWLVAVSTLAIWPVADSIGPL